MAKENVKTVPDVMLADTPMEEREQILRDSCDQIVEKFYTRKFGAAEMANKRTEACDVAMQISELNKELKEVTADYKGKIKPLTERHDSILDEIRGRMMEDIVLLETKMSKPGKQVFRLQFRGGGEQVKGDTFKFMFEECGKVGFYDTNGHLVEQRDMTPEERQRTVFQAIRRNGTEG